MYNPELRDYMKIMPLKQPSEEELLLCSDLDSELPPDEFKRKFVIGSVVAIGVSAVGLGISRVLPYIRLSNSLNAKRLENTEKRFSRASETEFELDLSELLHHRIRTFGDSVEVGLNEEATLHPDSSYQVYGMNTNYNKYAESNSDIPGPVQWSMVTQAISGTETNQWDKQLENFEINLRILQMFEESLEDVPDTDEESDENFSDFNDLKNPNQRRSETWQIGSAGNGLFHLAYREIGLIKQLIDNNQDPEKIDELVNAVSDEDTATILSYKKDLETIHYLKQLGVNITGLVVVGIPDPTVLDVVPVENPNDPNGAPMLLNLNEHSNIREYASNTIKDMNNRIKEMVDAFMDEHPNIPVLYVGPEEFLTAEDMHDIHPDQRGYWKIARKILDHYYVKLPVKHPFLGRIIIKLYLGSIALPDNDPNKPAPENKPKVQSRRAFLRRFGNPR